MSPQIKAFKIVDIIHLVLLALVIVFFSTNNSETVKFIAGLTLISVFATSSTVCFIVKFVKLKTKAFNIITFILTLVVLAATVLYIIFYPYEYTTTRYDGENTYITTHYNYSPLFNLTSNIWILTYITTIIMYSINILYKQESRTLHTKNSNKIPSVKVSSTPVVKAPKKQEPDKFQQIEKWHNLFENGVISEQEYTKKKREILSK